MNTRDLNPDQIVQRETNLLALPEQCLTWHPTEEKKVIKLRKGIEGYIPMFKRTQEEIDAFNSDKGAKPEHIEAMLVGSMFGWHCKGADPANYVKA